MEYDFDRIVNRRNTGAMKWNVPASELPMWVADMDFETAPEVIEALRERVSHGVFGYNEPGDDWYDAYISWWRRRHNYEMKSEWLMFSAGVIPTLSSTVRKLTTPNENVLILTPVYNIFYNSIVNNGARVLECELKYDGEEYDIDWADLEGKMADPQTVLMFFCNPHNPVGKIWDAGTIAKIGELAHRYNVTVVSDEIHCDLTSPGRDYVPFISVSDTCRDVCVMCISPTKAFNLAGLQTSAVCIPNPILRYKVWRALNTDEVAEPNVFATVAAIAAFNKGEEWLDKLREYIEHNRRLVSEYIDDLAKEAVDGNRPVLRLIRGEATYLLWLDLRDYGLSSDDMQECLRKEAGLYLSTGSIYGKGGEGFLRMNIACPEATLKEGLSRLKKGLISLDRMRT